MGNTELAITLILDLLGQAQAIGSLIDKARSEKRDITDEEIDQLINNDDLARAKLESAIAAAR